jgi:hypothetical protein
MLLGYLLGLEEGKLSEKERQVTERMKIEEEHLNALREQYMLGLLMPVRGQEDFKVVVEEPKNFDFRMVAELLRRIESPVKYFKYYKVGDTYVLEGYSIGTGEYESWTRTERIHTALTFGSMAVFFILAFMLNDKVFHLEDTNPILFFFYQLFSFTTSFMVGAIVNEFAFPSRDKSILRYGKR